MARCRKASSGWTRADPPIMRPSRSASTAASNSADCTTTPAWPATGTARTTSTTGSRTTASTPAVLCALDDDVEEDGAAGLEVVVRDPVLEVILAGPFAGHAGVVVQSAEFEIAVEADLEGRVVGGSARIHPDDAVRQRGVGDTELQAVERAALDDGSMNRLQAVGGDACHQVDACVRPR